MNKQTKHRSFSSSTLGGALFAAVVAAGFCIGANAAAPDSTAPEAHSDGIVAAVSDAALTAEVKARLLEQDDVKLSDVHVTTTNGVVTLTGHVPSGKAKSLALAQASSVEGVKSIDNQIVAPGGSTTAEKAKRVVSDSWITTKVKSELLADNVSRGFGISVSTVRGVVVLKGALESQDAIDHAKDIAARVEGVKSVDISGLTLVTG
jgi:hyperosmotically inducible protein